MTEEIDDNEQQLEYGKEHELAINALLQDLTRLYPTDKAAFRDLFYDRESQRTKFSVLLKDKCRILDNFVIEGKAGVGKTSFIYSIESDEELRSELNFTPIVVDYRGVVGQSWEICLLNFITSMDKCFKKIGYPIHSLKENSKSNMDENINFIQTHLINLPEDNERPSIVIFLDDFDYAEDDWYKLLKYFLSFASSDITSIVLSARPPLLAAIDSYDERFSFYFTRKPNTIKLGNLNVQNILSARLAPLLAERETQSLWSAIVSTFKRKSAVQRMLKQLGIKDIDALTKFDFPLTDKHCDFMTSITNGNLREIFSIGIQSIIFALEKGNHLKSRIEGGIKRKVIGHEKTLKMFYGHSNPHKYKIININKYKSKKNNSLLYNVLEAVKISKVINSDFYESLTTSSLGHKKKEIDWAIEFLSDKVNRFIEPTKLLPAGREKIINLHKEFKLLDKGKYYLYMADWDEYKSDNRAGDYGKSLIKELKL